MKRATYEVNLAQIVLQTSGRPDSNRGPRPPKGRALPGCATPRPGQSRGGRGRSGDGPERAARAHPLAFGPMADVRPIHALHYDLDEGRLAGRGGGAALRRDRRGRAGAPAGPLPLQRGCDRPAEAVRPRRPRQRPEGDPYEEAARKIDAWREEGVLVADAEPAIWAMTQDYTAPDGAPTPATASSPGCGWRTTRPAPSARTSAPTPGRCSTGCELTRATLHNLSPIFSLSTVDPWPLVEPALGPEPWGEATDPDGTVNRRLAGRRPGGRWRRVTERARRRPAADRRRPPPLRDRPRLPRRGRRRGPAELHADGAHRPRRPGPHRLPHPPAALRLRRGSRAPDGGSAPGCASCSRSRRSRASEIDPAGERGRRRLRPLRLLPQAGLPAAPQGHRGARPAPRGQARGLPPPRLGDPRDARAQGPGRDERPRHRRAPRARIRQERPGGAGDGRRGALRRRLHPAPGPGRAGEGGGRDRARTCRRSRPTSSPR